MIKKKSLLTGRTQSFDILTFLDSLKEYKERIKSELLQDDNLSIREVRVGNSILKVINIRDRLNRQFDWKLLNDT